MSKTKKNLRAGTFLKTKEKVVPFEREANYYLHKGMHYYQKNKFEKALVYFKKATEVEPGNVSNHYNLACLLSKMGWIKEANSIFHYILDEMEEPLDECYFLLAINYGLLEDLDKSREYLRLYLEAEPEGEMAFEAMDLLEALGEDFPDEDCPKVDEEKRMVENMLLSCDHEQLEEEYRDNERFRRAIHNRLYQLPDSFKEEIISFYGKLGGSKSERVLLEYVKNPWVKERFRQMALLQLRKIGSKGPVQVFREGGLAEIDPVKICLSTLPIWKKEWQQVLDCTKKNMSRSKSYDDGFFDDIKAIWMDFINNAYPLVPCIRKVEAWSAALEYSLARFHYLNLTQKELSQEYGVSVTSISGNFKKINEVLHIDKKARQNIIKYLKGD